MKTRAEQQAMVNDERRRLTMTPQQYEAFRLECAE